MNMAFLNEEGGWGKDSQRDAEKEPVHYFCNCFISHLLLPGNHDQSWRLRNLLLYSIWLYLHLTSIKLVLYEVIGWQNKTAIKNTLQLIIFFSPRNLFPPTILLRTKLQAAPLQEAGIHCVFINKQAVCNSSFALTPIRQKQALNITYVDTME